MALGIRGYPRPAPGRWTRASTCEAREPWEYLDIIVTRYLPNHTTCGHYKRRRCRWLMVARSSLLGADAARLQRSDVQARSALGMEHRRPPSVPKNVRSIVDGPPKASHERSNYTPFWETGPLTSFLQQTLVKVDLRRLSNSNKVDQNSGGDGRVRRAQSVAAPADLHPHADRVRP
jgi:hypothetical protein